MAKDAKKQALRERILVAARDVFLDRGFSEAKIGDIAAAVGISPSTLYHYFSGKKALFATLDIPQAAGVRPEFDQKRDALVKTALGVFGEQGFENTTMDDIADRAGLSKAALYQFCSSKEELFLLTLDYFIDTGVQRPGWQKDGLEDWRDYLRKVGNACIARSLDPGRNAFLGAVIRDSKKFPIFGKVYYEKSYKAARKAFVAFFRWHQEAGHIRPDADLVSTADVFQGILMSYVVLFRIASGIDCDVDPETYIARAVEIFANDLEVKTPSPSHA